jgi:Flp pilus assembly protein protease CpaA
MTEQLIISAVVLVWLVVCAVQDWKSGEVSNWLTIPAMALGMGYAVYMGRERLILVAAALAGLMLLYVLGSLGGADVKVLIALAGLWPAAMLAALLVQGIWGGIVLIKEGRGAEFRAIPAYALGAILSIVLFFGG